MDAKSKANFINSVAAGQVVPCPKCGAANRPGTAYCANCGSSMIAPKNAPAFAPVTESAPVEVRTEPISVFAEGLPTWDIVPPQVVVRRR